jgi:multidrug efflux pump subunit AcrA (membrane-fusion protein)
MKNIIKKSVINKSGTINNVNKISISYWRILVAIVLPVFLFACQEESTSPLLYTVTSKTHAIHIPAKGELFADTSTIVSAPMSNNGVQIISWLAPEFSTVKAGDIIARFDGEAMQLSTQNHQNKHSLTQQDMIEMKSSLALELNSINKDINIVSQEKNFAEQFSIDDIRIRSKLDIIDSMQNSAYLSTKKEYLFWKSDRFDDSSKGDMSLLNMQQQQHEAKLTQLSSSLSLLAVKAPHDGLLVYKADWRGEKIRAGQPLWPGQKIAELPNLNVMKAKLFVLENEALALEKDKPVTFRLNAHDEKEFQGSIESVAPFPTTIKRGNPQKYFEVVVSLSTQNINLFMPGSKITADIIIEQATEKMIIPLQSVFSKKNNSYVYLYENNDFIEQPVTLGKASLSHVEIIAGLTTNQQIALTDKDKH